MTSFGVALESAKLAKEKWEVVKVLEDVEARLGRANSALAVDSARQIVEALIKSLKEGT